jgi:hypothetical protein
VTKVAFLVNGSVRAVDRSAPFRSTWHVPWRVSHSSHRVKVRARAYEGGKPVATSKRVSLRRLRRHAHRR